MTQFKKTKKVFTELRNDSYVIKWIENYNENQQQARLRILNDYVEFIGKTPKELILEHSKDIKQDDPLNQTDIGKKQIFKFYNYLVNDKLVSKNSAIQYVFSKLTGFFARNKVPIILEKGEKPKMGKGVKDKVMRVQKSKIEQVVSETTPSEKASPGDEIKMVRVKDKKSSFKKIRDTLKTTRDRAILLCKISSGLDDVDLFNLKLKDFVEGYIDDLDVCYLEGNRKKVDEYFQTFFSGESCAVIDIYLRERKKRGEKLTPKSWLFVSNKAVKGKYGKPKAQAFSENLKIACETLGIKNVTPKYFRRWFSTELKRNGIKHEIVERLMGHAGGISMDYEQLFDDDEEFAEYYKNEIEPIISLGNGNLKYQKLDTEVQKLKQTIEILKKIITKSAPMMTDDPEGIEPLLKELEELK